MAARCTGRLRTGTRLADVSGEGSGGGIPGLQDSAAQLSVSLFRSLPAQKHHKLQEAVAAMQDFEQVCFTLEAQVMVDLHEEEALLARL